MLLEVLASLGRHVGPLTKEMKNIEFMFFTNGTVSSGYQWLLSEMNMTDAMWKMTHWIMDGLAKGLTMDEIMKLHKVNWNQIGPSAWNAFEIITKIMSKSGGR